MANTVGASSTPTFSFDPITKLISLDIDNTEYGYNENDKINILINAQLNTLLSSLPVNPIFLSENCDYQINNLIVSDPSIMTQEYLTVLQGAL